MTAQANIVAFDGAASPVSHTLVPESNSKESDGSLVAKWKESLAGVPDYAQVRCSMTKPKLPSGVFRTTSRAEVPVMEAILNQNSSGYTAPPKVAYVDTVETVGYFHERGVVTGRRLARQLAVNIMGNISTTVTPVTTGPAPELFDQLLMPT